MEYTIVVPPTADGSMEVTIVSWLKQIGDSLQKGEDIAEAATEKITLYITSPADGTLKRTDSSAGAKVRVGDVIGIVVNEAEED